MSVRIVSHNLGGTWRHYFHCDGCQKFSEITRRRHEVEQWADAHRCEELGKTMGKARELGKAGADK